VKVKTEAAGLTLTNSLTDQSHRLLLCLRRLRHLGANLRSNPPVNNIALTGKLTQTHGHIEFEGDKKKFDFYLHPVILKSKSGKDAIFGKKFRVNLSWILICFNGFKANGYPTLARLIIDYTEIKSVLKATAFLFNI
jgi:hypothetical protein